MGKRTFTQEEMLDVLGGDDVIKDVISGTSRWAIHHELTFKDGDKFYRTHYRVGATESQEETPWQDVDTVDAVEVKEVEVVKKEWVPV